jgi:hypothetical protein
LCWLPPQRWSGPHPHLAHDEDQNNVTPHWSSFNIVPWDWSAMNPMEGGATPTITLTQALTQTLVPAQELIINSRGRIQTALRSD